MTMGGAGSGSLWLIEGKASADVFAKPHIRSGISVSQKLSWMRWEAGFTDTHRNSLLYSKKGKLKNSAGVLTAQEL